MSYKRLTTEDLIRDEPLASITGGEIPPELDTLNHRAIARRVAELASVSVGQQNIALFGPWGSGKSSFYGLMKQELETFDSSTRVVHFDAWKNAGPGFQANFLSEIQGQVNGDKSDDAAISLFTTRRTVRLPFGFNNSDPARKRRWLWKICVSLVLLFFGLPALWTLITFDASTQIPWIEQAVDNAVSWFGLAAGSSLLIAFVGILAEASKVTIEESSPSHVSQFGALFDRILSSRSIGSPRSSTKYVIFVDELDRCAPEDVMRTLEGLRTFLGHKQCVFVVAFDRDAVALTIKHHLERDRDIPARPDRPYYSTAGEYLDKIFQFQISLPPQSPHTFRKYALALVNAKEKGFWTELPSSALPRIVAILSPVHVTSPRRTKVLLNDFAVNSRVFESLGFAWLERAEEIAALTVIQTEFPKLASQIEREPGLLGALATLTAPERPGLAFLYHQYTGSSGASLDEIVDSQLQEVSTDSVSMSESDTKQSETIKTAGSVPPKTNQQNVADQLLANLQRFLRTLEEIQCQIPRADLILMHSSDQLLAFDDLNVYNTLLRAADIPIGEATKALESVSEKDAMQSIQYLLEHVEGELPDSIVRYVAIIGDLVVSLPADNLDSFAATLIGQWKKLANKTPNAVSRFTDSGLQGIARVIALSGNSSDIQNMHQLVAMHRGTAHARVLTELIVSSKGKVEDTTNTYLGRSAIKQVTLDSGPLWAFLNTNDAAGEPLSEQLAEELANSLTVEAIEEIAPTTATAGAREEAATANELAKRQYDEAITSSSRVVSELIAILPETMPNGPAHNWVFDVLSTLLDTSEWAVALHDEAIESVRASGNGLLANNLLLESIARGPALFLATWTEKINANDSAGHQQVHDALFRLLQMLADEEVETSERVSTVAAVAAVTQLATAHQLSVDLERLEGEVSVLIRRDWAVGELSILLAARNALSSLSALGLTEEAVVGFITDLYFGFVEHADDAATSLDNIAIELTKERVIILRDIERRSIEWLKADPEREATDVLRLLLAAQSLLLQRGERVTTLPASHVVRLNDPEGNVPHLRHWVITGPDLAEVKDVAENFNALEQVTANEWRLYSQRATRESRTGGWRWHRERGSAIAILTAIASNEVEDHLYGELADLVIAGATHQDRLEANKFYLSLPRANRSAAVSAIKIAMGLAETANKVDASMVAGNLLSSVNHMNASERKRLKGILDSWIEKATSVSQKMVKDLRDAGLLPQKKGWIVDRLGLK